MKCKHCDGSGLEPMTPNAKKVYDFIHGSKRPVTTGDILQSVGISNIQGISYYLNALLEQGRIYRHRKRPKNGGHGWHYEYFTVGE